MRRHKFVPFLTPVNRSPIKGSENRLLINTENDGNSNICSICEVINTGISGMKAVIKEAQSPVPGQKIQTKSYPYNVYVVSRIEKKGISYWRGVVKYAIKHVIYHATRSHSATSPCSTCRNN